MWLIHVKEVCWELCELRSVPFLIPLYLVLLFTLIASIVTSEQRILGLRAESTTLRHKCFVLNNKKKAEENEYFGEVNWRVSDVSWNGLNVWAACGGQTMRAEFLLGNLTENGHLEERRGNEKIRLVFQLWTGLFRGWMDFV